MPMKPIEIIKPEHKSGKPKAFPLIARIACIAFALLTLAGCGQGQYLAVEYNRKSRVYRPIVSGDSADESVYSFDLYQNKSLPLKHYGSGLLYYFMSSYDVYTPPLPALLDANTGAVTLMCTDESCCHKKVYYTSRCVLCDIYDTSRIAVMKGKLYFAHADKSYFDESTGQKSYYFNTMYSDEVEFPYELIQYDISGAAYKSLYSVDAGSYIDFIYPYNDYIYFYETTYEELTGLSLVTSNANFDIDGQFVSGGYTFRNGEDGSYVNYDAMLFYNELTKRHYSEFYEHIKERRKMKLEGDVPWKKVYILRRLKLSDKSVETLAHTESLPAAFDIIDGRIYEYRGGDGYISYDLDYNTEYESPAQPGPVSIITPAAAYGMTNIQYDQFTHNIYYLKSGTLCKVKTAGESYRQVREMDLCPGLITWYQLTLEGIYFMQSGDNAIYFAQYTDINYDNVPYSAVITPTETLLDGGSLVYPTAFGGDFYFSIIRRGTEKEDGTFEFIQTGLYKFDGGSGEVSLIWPEGWALTK